MYSKLNEEEEERLVRTEIIFLCIQLTKLFLPAGMVALAVFHTLLSPEELNRLVYLVVSP